MTVFDMIKIEKKIYNIRKEKNLTQLELADKLGISYQAVSNWERGDSMPDISKLNELSNIFEVSIDYLLDNNKQAEEINDILEERTVDINKLEKEELVDILPAIKPEQFKKSFTDFSNISLEFLLMLAPFLEVEQIDNIVREKIESNEEVEYISLFPFVSDKVLIELFKKEIKKENINTGLLVGLLPFISKDTIKEFANHAKEFNKYHD